MDISTSDRAAIQAILGRQSTAWCAGDAAAFTADTADDVIFTNIIGMFSIGRALFLEQHARIFSTIYKGSTLKQDLVAITAIRPDVAIVDTLALVTNAPHHPPGIELIDGAVRTRLEQVMVMNAGKWQVAAFHNVAVHPAALANS